MVISGVDSVLLERFWIFAGGFPVTSLMDWGWSEKLWR